ncbi:mitochondrial ribosomal protein of the large subunit [Myxozyma melibiosi]|uniref:Mitochondrial ribosomal protein of the large subunit n=1 Tax=Myxozyma melibiosi TaxID=54550 RepID=A0ABR1FB26_9ASCO
MIIRRGLTSRLTALAARPMLYAGPAPAAAATTTPALVRFKSSKPAKGGNTAPVAGFVQREAAAKKADKDKRLRDQKRKIELLRRQARTTRITPITMGIEMAARYLRAAEVGRPDGTNMITLMVKQVNPLHFQAIRGSVRLPKAPSLERVAVFTDNEEEAAAALANGATYAGGAELVDKVLKEEITFEKSFATPTALPLLRGVQRILGPKGLMPNERRGTVGTDIVGFLRASSGTMDFRTIEDMLQVNVARTTFTDEEIKLNIKALMDAYRLAVVNHEQRHKPLILEVMLTSTHGPAVNILA